VYRHPGSPQQLRPVVRGHPPCHGRIMGQFSADLFDGRHHQYGNAAIIRLGGGMGARLIIVSNRVAVPDPGGKPSPGGMAVAVKAALKHRTGMWFGWSGEVQDATSSEPRIIERKGITYAVIDITNHDFQEYYNGFANRVLWPILHYRVDLAEYSRSDLSGY